MKVKLSVEQLEAVWQALVYNLKQKGIKEISINESYYWKINDEDLYNVYDEPKELTIGNLADEWPWLLGMANEPDDAIIYAFGWFSEILRAISIKQSDIPERQSE